MPELPEVETCRRALEPLVLGADIGSYHHGDHSLRHQAEPQAMAELVGRRIVALSRRGKYLIFECGEEAFLVHLGMTGQLFMSPHSAEWKRHEHWRLKLSNGLLRYQDPRRFGMLMRCRCDQLEQHPRLAKLGPEPLSGDWSAGLLVSDCGASRKPIKHLIMDATRVVGVGNIYAAEALFAARIHPTRPANSINPKRLVVLHGEIIAVLERALESGGSTVRDFRSSDGAPGYFAQELKVYGRAGQACTACQRQLKSLVSGGRSTVYCGHCQR
jgi:formamidopyrimidine-DNA glycosylase